MKLEARKFRNTRHILIIAENERERITLDGFFRHEFKLKAQNQTDAQSINHLKIELCSDDAYNPYIRINR